MIVRGDSINKESSHMGEGGAMEDVNPPLTVTGSGRTIISNNIEQSIETVTVGTIDMTGTAGIVDSSQMETTPSPNTESATTTKYIKMTKGSIAESSPDGDMNTIDGDGDEDDETSTRISEPTSAMKFQPLQPISEKSLSPSLHQSNSENSSAQDHTSTQTFTAFATKESGSFMNNIQDPVAASKVFKKFEPEIEHENSLTQQMSHTPPTSMSTSYETMHFGKRPRSGVSFFETKD